VKHSGSGKAHVGIEAERSLEDRGERRSIRSDRFPDDEEKKGYQAERSGENGKHRPARSQSTVAPEIWETSRDGNST